MLPDHNSTQSHQEERQKKPTQDALNYDVVPVLSRRQKVDWPLRKEDTSTEKQGVAENHSFRNGVLLDRALQGLG